MKIKIFSLFLFFWSYSLGVTVTNTFTGPGGDMISLTGNATIVTDHGDTIDVLITWTVNSESGAWTGRGARIVSSTLGSNSPISSGTTVTVMDGDWRVQIYVSHLSSYSDVTTGDFLHSEDPPPYYFDFSVAANTSAHTIYYKVYQGGELKLNYAHAAGAGSATVHVTSVTASPPIITVVASTGGWVSDESGVPSWEDNRYQEVVGGGESTNSTEPPLPVLMLTPSNPGASAPYPSPPPIPPPTPPSAPDAPAPTTPPAAPAPVAPKPPPTPAGNPYPTPTGIGGLTKEDFEGGINKLVQDANETRDQNVANANKILEGLNSVATSENESSKKVINAVDAGTAKNKESLDAVRTAVTNFSTAQINSMNQLNAQTSAGFGRVAAGLTSINDGIQSANGTLVSLGEKLDALNQSQAPPSSEDIQDLLDSMVNTAETTAGEAETLLNARETPIFEVSSEVTSPPSIFAWTILGREIDIDPVVRWPWLFQWVKALFAWCIAAAFIWWVWGKLSAMMLEITHPHGGPWNHQAVTGGVPPLIGLGISAFLTGVLMAAVLAVPVAFFALLDSGAFIAQLSFASADPRSLIAAPSGVGDAILYLLDASFPVTTGLVVLLEMFVIVKGKTVIVSGLRVFQKAIPL